MNVSLADRRTVEEQLRSYYFGIEPLTGHANARQWADQIATWLRAKGQAGSTMLGHYKEPFRRDYETASDDLKKVIRPEGERAGDNEPRGLQIDPAYVPAGSDTSTFFPRGVAWTAVPSSATAQPEAPAPAARATRASGNRDPAPHLDDTVSEGGTPTQRRASPTQYTITPTSTRPPALPESQRFLTELDRRTWREWAKWENMTRAAILSTVHGSLATVLNRCWDSHEMYKHIMAEYFKPTAELYQTILSQFSNLRLDYPCSAAGMLGYLNDFLAIVKDAEECQFTLSEEEKIGRLLGGMNPNHYATFSNLTILLADVNDAPLDFDRHVAIFRKMISRQATGEAMDSHPMYYSYTASPAPRQTSYTDARFGQNTLYQQAPPQQASTSPYQTFTPRFRPTTHAQMQNPTQPQQHPQYQTTNQYPAWSGPLREAIANLFCTWCERTGHTWQECRQRLQGRPSKRMTVRGGQLEMQKYLERQAMQGTRPSYQPYQRPPARPQPGNNRAGPINTSVQAPTANIAEQAPLNFGTPHLDDSVDPEMDAQTSGPSHDISFQETVNFVDDAYDNYDLPYTEQDFRKGAVMNVTYDGAASTPAVTDASDWQRTAQQSIVHNRAAVPVEYVLDSGASSHIVRDPCLLTNIRPVRPIHFTSAALNHSFSSGRVGTLTIRFNPYTVALIHDVYLCTGISRNLLSAKKLIDNKWVVLLNDDQVVFRGVKVAIGWPSNIAVIRMHTQRNEPHLVLATKAHYGNPIIDSSPRKSPLHSIHERLAHTSRTALLRLAKEGKISLSHKMATEDAFRVTDCYSCVAGTLHRLPSKGEGPRALSQQADTLQCDFAGPFTESESGHFTQALFMKTDFTNIGFAFPCKQKNQDTMVRYLGFVIRHLRLRGVTIALVCADNAFDVPAVKQVCHGQGVAMRFSPPYEHNVTGQIERFIGVVKSRARAVMLATPFPSKFWDYAINYVVDVINMTSQSGIPDMSPWEIWSGRKPHLDKIRQFGQFVLAHISLDTGRRAKNDLDQPVNQLGRHLGFDRESSGYKVRLEVNGHVITTAQVRTGPPYPLSTPLRPTTFTPDTHPRGVPVLRNDGDDPLALEPTGPIIPPLLRKHLQHTATGHSPAASTAAAPGGSTSADPPAEQQAPTTATAQPGASPQQSHALHFAPGRPPDDTHNCGDHPLNFTPSVQHAEDTSDSHFALAAIGQHIATQVPTPGAPRNYRQAMKTPEAHLWQQAYDSEIAQLRARGTWRECVAPPGVPLIPSVTVAKEKKDKDGNVIGRKMRICAMGSRQVQGRDYLESYASVCDASIMRGMIAFAAHNDMELEHADAIAAFLNPDLDKPVYMRFPSGYVPLDPQSNCLKLLKGLYGLPQSGNLWQEMATNALVSLRFQPIPQSDCLFQRDTGTPEHIRVALYVDDMLGAGKTHDLLDNFWDKLNEKFAITKLGPVQHLLGMTIERDRFSRTIFITQMPYVKEILQRFPSFNRTVGKHTPLPASADLYASSAAITDAKRLTEYKAVVGSLQWAAIISRPDIAFTAAWLGRYGSKPTELHMELAYHCLSYLHHTCDWGFVLGGTSDITVLRAFSDASYACDRKDTRQSTTGSIIMLGDSLVDGKSKRQRCVTKSTGEAEYVAGSDTAANVAFWIQLMDAFGQPARRPASLYIDNASAVCMATNGKISRATRHIDVAYHFVKQFVRQGQLRVERVGTKDQVADILTKPLSPQLHDAHCRRLRIGPWRDYSTTAPTPSNPTT